MWHRSSKASRGAMHVVWQSVAVETVVKAEQDGRGGRQTKELMRETGDFSHVTPPRPRLSEDLHVLPRDFWLLFTTLAASVQLMA